MLVQPLVQLLKVFGPMPGEVDGMQTIRRMDAGVARTQPSDTRPAVDINGRHDHVADAGVMGTFDDGLAIGLVNNAWKQCHEIELAAIQLPAGSMDAQVNTSAAHYGHYAATKQRRSWG